MLVCVYDCDCVCGCGCDSDSDSDCALVDDVDLCSFCAQNVNLLSLPLLLSSLLHSSLLFSSPLPSSAKLRKASEKIEVRRKAYQSF